MSKAFIAQVLQESADLTGIAANRAAGDLMDAVVKELKKRGQVYPAKLRHLHRAQDQGAQGTEPPHRRVDQGEGRQDGAFQGIAVAEEVGLIRHATPLTTRPGFGVLVVALGTLVVPFDSSVNFAFPFITRAFGLPIPAIQWVVIAYTLTYAALMLVFGRVGDMLGYRRIFLAGSLWSAVAFVLCALAPSYGALLVARVLQGVGAALVLSCGPALATSLHPELARTRILGIYTMVIGIGGALGPLIAGLLVPLIDWPAVFWFRAPLALSAFLLAWLLPADTRPAHREKFDAAGGALLVLAISAMLLALNQLQHITSDRLRFAVAAFACVVATGWFIVQERRTERPIIDLRYFKRSRFLAAERRTCGAESGRLLRAAAGTVLSEPLR